MYSCAVAISPSLWELYKESYYHPRRHVNNSTLASAMSPTAEEKFDLVTRRLHEVLGADIIKKVLEERDLKGYWGESTETATLT